MEPNPQTNDPGELSGSPSSISSAPQAHFVSLKLKGVGGWLMFFVIGQLVLRPLLYFGSDLPETFRSQLILSGITNAAGTSLVGLAWFWYFTKSKRVHATYLGEIN